LCCTADQPPLRYCTTCGGDYPVLVGAKLDVGDWGPYSTYGVSCAGGLATTWNPFQICGRNIDTCMFCYQRCGGGYVDNGAVLPQADYGSWQGAHSNFCVSNAQWHTAIVMNVNKDVWF